MKYLTLSIFIIFSFHVKAYAESISETGLPLPRFVSLKSDKAFMRKGPGKRYSIKWVYKRKGFPIKIINEYEHWRQVEDFEGIQGWMHKSVLSGVRTAIVTHDNIVMRDKPNASGDIKANITKNVIVKIDNCRPEWCSVEVADKSGWLPSSLLWGVRLK